MCVVLHVAVVASAEAKIDSMKALIAYAKANPGKLNIGAINVGSTQHLSAELFRSMAGFDATVLPYKGSPAVITALRANDVQVAFEMLAPVARRRGGAHPRGDLQRRTAFPTADGGGGGVPAQRRRGTDRRAGERRRRSSRLSRVRRALAAPECAVVVAGARPTR
ncbi:MAG: hypothetical protein IPG84_09275 [Betaproteobacteria bacterium]|nr:hypothetical protein [Betaproteobacteria bacterium]